MDPWNPCGTLQKLASVMDEYVQPALWLNRITPDPRLPGKATPFLLLSGRDCRTQMDATSPSPNDKGMEGLHNLIADKSENLRQVQEVRKDLQHRRLRREHQNAGIRRTSTGTRMKQGDLVLVKEADSALHYDCETDPRSMERTVDRHSIDDTSIVLPRHPSGETGGSTVRSSFSHEALSPETPIAASRF